MSRVPESVVLSSGPRIFALSESRRFAEKVCAQLGSRLGEHEERQFSDGEHKSRPLESARGKDVFVIQSLYDEPGCSVNDKLCRLLFFLGALRDASADRITAVLPYLCYARKDRKTKTRDPVTSRYVAQLLEAVGVDGVVTLDVHNLAAYQNAFRCRTDHLEAKKRFVEHFASLANDERIVVVSPDVGGVKRAELFRQALGRYLSHEAGSAFMEKQRSGGVVSGEAVVGDVADAVTIIVDDLISTGGTIARTAHACKLRGASKIYAAASHGIFVGDANRTLSGAPLDQLLITDTVPPFRLDSQLFAGRLTVLEVAPLFAEAIQRIHSGRSIVELLEV
jgi:ribose-phosphate pyrophosphokinase